MGLVHEIVVLRSYRTYRRVRYFFAFHQPHQSTYFSLLTHHVARSFVNCVFFSWQEFVSTHLLHRNIGGGNGFLGPVGHRQMMNPSVMNLEHRPS